MTAAELLSVAAFGDGRFAQAFPSFGSERTGAPVVAYCRVAGARIRTREPIVRPDALIVLDATLVHQVDLFRGVSSDGYILVNSSRTFDDLGLSDVVQAHLASRVATVPATELALTHTGRPVPNAVLLGGFAAMTDVVSLDAVVQAIRARFTGAVADGNAAAAREAFDLVARDRKALTRAPTT